MNASKQPTMHSPKTLRGRDRTMLTQASSPTTSIALTEADLVRYSGSQPATKLVFKLSPRLKCHNTTGTVIYEQLLSEDSNVLLFAVPYWQFDHLEKTKHFALIMRLPSSTLSGTVIGLSKRFSDQGLAYHYESGPIDPTAPILPSGPVSEHEIAQHKVNLDKHRGRHVRNAINVFRAAEAFEEGQSRGGKWTNPRDPPPTPTESVKSWHPSDKKPGLPRQLGRAIKRSVSNALLPSKTNRNPEHRDLSSFR